MQIDEYVPTIDALLREHDARRHNTRCKTIAALLKQAADLHHAHEQALGHHDEDWPAWYANWLEPKLREIFK